MNRLSIILKLDNETQAQAVHEELNLRDIPHLLRSYHDTAYDGLFQQSMGWGHIEAEPQYKDAIIQAFNELEQNSPAEDNAV